MNELLNQSFALITALEMMEVDPDLEPNLAGYGGDDREERTNTTTATPVTRTATTGSTI